MARSMSLMLIVPGGAGKKPRRAALQPLRSKERTRRDRLRERRIRFDLLRVVRRTGYELAIASVDCQFSGQEAAPAQRGKVIFRAGMCGTLV